MSDYSTGKETIEGCVRALAECVGITPTKLDFTWEELEGINTQGTEIRPDEKIETVRVCFQKKWSTLFFPESEMKNLDTIAERIFINHKRDILEALRRLKGLGKPVQDSECPDRWVPEGDWFPGEPA